MRISFSQLLVLGLILFLLFGDFTNVKKKFVSFFEKFKK
nr:Sec-independent protein translocase component tatA/E [Nitzschia dissipata]QYB23055.1 Sec-independent protein translocase component tatA/E [Nitzschia dissipata]